ncbi:MAG: calcium-binding protein [Pseudomonadota bacterium]
MFSDLKLSDLKGYYDFAFSVLGTTTIDWNAVIAQLENTINAIPAGPAKDALVAALPQIKAGIATFQSSPAELLALSKAEVDAYFAQYGDITLGQLQANIGGTTTPVEPSTIPSILADILKGGDLAEAIFGQGGDDTIDGGAGADTLGGGEGNDNVSGGLGSDVLYGFTGNDVLYAEALEALIETATDVLDTLYGGEGNDTLFGGLFKDISFGGEGNDNVNSGGSDDIAYGGRGDDALFGGKGNDILGGGAGNDTLGGGEGDDVIYTGAGNDLAYGGTGADAIYGGSGDDTVYMGANDGARDVFAAGVSGAAVVNGFEVGTDVISYSFVPGVSSFAGLNISSDASGNAVIEAGQGTVTLVGVQESALTADSFIF